MRARQIEKLAAMAVSDEGDAAVAPPADAAAAFATVRPEIDAMPANDLGRITVSVPAAVSIGLGALPNIEGRREELRAKLPEYDVGRAGRLRDYAYAALYAHLVALRHSDGESRLRAIVAEASPLRERLLRAAELHAHYGVFDAEHVAAIRKGTGYSDTANDLIELSMLFRDSRDKLAGQTPVTPGDIARAAELGTQLIDALGRRRVGTEGAKLSAQLEGDRARAFWLFHGVYEESRRAMTYLRWHQGDADQLVPSLFAARRRRAPSVDGPDGLPAPAEPVDPAEGD